MKNKSFKVEGVWQSAKGEDYLPVPVKDGLNAKWRKRIANTIRRRQSSVRTVQITHKGIVRDFFDSETRFKSINYRLNKWQWPEGFAYMVETYGVRPSDAFLQWLKIDPEQVEGVAKRAKRNGNTIGLRRPKRLQRQSAKTNAAKPGKTQTFVEEVSSPSVIDVSNLNDKKLLGQINADILKALQPVVTKYGLDVVVSGGRLGRKPDSEVYRTFKPGVVITTTKEHTNPEADAFGKAAIKIGLTKADYLRKVVVNDKVYHIVGIGRSMIKPVICQDPVTKRQSRFTVKEVTAHAKIK